MKIVLASNNKHKIEEISSIMKGYEILPMSEVGYNDDIEENGTTFYENALIKAKAVYEFLKNKNKDYIVVSDDSGLCVEALDGRPGIYSARYSGEHGNNKENRKKLLSEMKDKINRNAYFNCTMVAILPSGEIIEAVGRTYGEIMTEEKGSNGFGFDSLFYYPPFKKTFAQIQEEEKNSVSHRSKACHALFDKLKKSTNFKH